MASAPGVAVVGGDDHGVLRQIDVGEDPGNGAIGDRSGLAILGAVTAAGVAGGVDRADQEDHEVRAAGGQRAAGFAEPARPRRIARIVERRGEIGVR